MAKPTKGESTPEYGKKIFQEIRHTEGCFPTYDMLKITENSQDVHHDFPCIHGMRQISRAPLSSTTSDWGCWNMIYL